MAGLKFIMKKSVAFKCINHSQLEPINRKSMSFTTITNRFTEELPPHKCTRPIKNNNQNTLKQILEK